MCLLLNVSQGLWNNTGLCVICLPSPSVTICFPLVLVGEGNGNPLQSSCLENPMDRRAWQATVHGVARVGHDLATKERERVLVLLALTVTSCRVCISTPTEWMRRLPAHREIELPGLPSLYWGSGLESTSARLHYLLLPQ